MVITFKAEDLLDDGQVCSLKGTIRVDVPPFPERQAFALKAGFAEYKPDHSDSEEAKLKNAAQLYEINGRVAAQVLERVVDCDLVSDDKQTVVRTRDEFSCHPEASPLVEALMAKFLNNFAGKKNMPLPSSR